MVKIEQIVKFTELSNIPENVIGEIKERRAKYYFPDFCCKTRL